MSKRVHFSGEKIGRMVLVTNINNHKWVCRCECGTEKTKNIGDLVQGKTVSCGCAHREAMGKFNRKNATHQLSRTPTYSSWGSMMNRCTKPNATKWASYGAVGIKPCAFISESPANLIAVIGTRPSGTTLDRIKNAHGYWCGSCPECISKKRTLNIRWATPLVQGRNKTAHHLITIKGITKCLSEWSKELGVWRLTLAYRHKMGWSDERIVQKAR